MLWCSQPKAGLANSNQKESGFGKLHRVLSKGHIRGRPWEVGETVDRKGGWQSHIRNFNLLVALQAVI